MKISNLSAQALQSAQARASQTDRAESSPSSLSAPAQAGDSVNLSAAGKAAQQDSVAGLGFARKALAAQPELGEERIGQIMQRIQNDYYSNPEVMRDIAQKVAQSILPQQS
jgi:hypothetical protein